MIATYKDNKYHIFPLKHTDFKHSGINLVLITKI